MAVGTTAATFIQRWTFDVERSTDLSRLPFINQLLE